MTNVIFCVALGKKNKMYQLSIESIKQYAKKVNAKLIINDQPYFKVNWKVAQKFFTKKQARLAWVEKLYALKLLESYNRVLLLDTDILITPHAPDIFAAYPDENKNYALSETLYDTRSDRDGQYDIHRLEHIVGQMAHWPHQGPVRHYFNSGVVLFSKNTHIHQHFSLKEIKTLFNEIVYLDQTYLNYLSFKYQIPLGELDTRYNWMPHLHKKNRHAAYFVHHSLNGCGISKCLKVHTFVNDYCRYYHSMLRFICGAFIRYIASGPLLLSHNLEKLCR